MTSTLALNNTSLRLQANVHIVAGPTVDIASAEGDLILVDGAGANIASLGTPVPGMIKWLRFLDVNTILQGPTINLPGALNVVTSADTILGFAVFQTVWRLISRIG